MPSLINQISIVNGKLVQLDDMLVKYAYSSSVTPTPTPEPTPVPPPEPPFDPLNPLGLPPFTIRCKFTAGYTPTRGTSQKCVDEDENVWDITNNSTNWDRLFQNEVKLIAVLGANTSLVTTMVETFDVCSALTTVAIFDTSAVTSMDRMFKADRALQAIPCFNTKNVTSMEQMLSFCTLTTVPLLDTSSVMNMDLMCQGCSNLMEIPLFSTTSVTNMKMTFAQCTQVQTGTLALYTQVSSQANPPSMHYGTFMDCGVSTTTGRAELQQIPNDWK
jgi:hypothetical protein